MTEITAEASTRGPDDELRLLEQTCHALLREREGDQRGPWDERLWRELEQAGLALIAVPERAGGSGGSLEQAAVAASAAGEHAARVPLAETSLLGGWLLAQAGLPVPAGPLVAVPAGLPGAVPPSPMAAGDAASAAHDFSVARVAGGWRARGRLPRVGWGRVAERVVVLTAADGAAAVVVLRPGDFAVEPGANVAGEPRDALTVDTVVDGAAVAAVPAGAGRELCGRAALARVLLIAGAAGRALDLTIRYAGEREQFGRPIGNFQAIQQQIAELAAETAAIKAAADAALRRCADDGFTHPAAWLAVAAAKVQAARGATAAARIAHQVHGAIGFTDEHRLRLSTTRLWAWRDEAGAAAAWAAELGRHALAADAPLWGTITGDR